MFKRNNSATFEIVHLKEKQTKPMEYTDIKGNNTFCVCFHSRPIRRDAFQEENSVVCKSNQSTPLLLLRIQSLSSPLRIDGGPRERAKVSFPSTLATHNKRWAVTDSHYSSPRNHRREKSEWLVWAFSSSVPHFRPMDIKMANEQIVRHFFLSSLAIDGPPPPAEGKCNWIRPRRKGNKQYCCRKRDER